MSESKRSDQKIKKQKQKRPPKKITPSYLHNAGLYYLERFAASSGHFRSVMMRKIQKSCYHHKEQDFDDCMTMLDQTIAQFMRSGLLDDQAYIRGNITSMRRRGLSARAIRSKLQAKSVPVDQIDQALKTLNDDLGISQQDMEYSSALTFARKKRLGPFYDKAPELPEELREKHLARLARQGFSYDICSKVIILQRDEAENLMHEMQLF